MRRHPWLWQIHPCCCWGAHLQLERMLTELMLALKKQLTEKLLPMPAQLWHVWTGLLLINNST